ncbi:MAG: endonuclease [Bacteroidales bacterium]|nr:endonuclease [Bacteroidales bacterium]MCF8454614.1 endonuclease [Bacteroidales bacterium]
MKFITYLFLLTICIPGLYAQAPTGYYSGTELLSGDTLKSVLHTIIDGHTEYPYTSTNTDTWDILKASDCNPANNSLLIMVYPGWGRSKAAEYPEWSREHVWSKSHGDFGTSMGPGTDLHNLKPEDVSVNSAKNNRDFDNGGTLYIDGDGATGCYTNTYSWEPRPEVKGDIARIIFYMATRYEGDAGEPDLEIVDYVNTAPSNQPLYGKLSTLLAWHVADPVDSFEMNRNNVIFSFQNNRNPFIDHPEFVDYIWGSGSPITAVSQSVLLKSGWSIISTYLIPTSPNITMVFSSVVNQLTILKNNGGDVFWPQFGLNLIGNMVLGQGYQCNMISQQTITILGLYENPANTPIALQQGWNLLGYLLQNPVNIATALSTLTGNIVIAKDGDGDIYWPAYNLNLIGNMEPGKGYQVKLTSAINFTYSSL